MCVCVCVSCPVLSSSLLVFRLLRLCIECVYMIRSRSWRAATFTLRFVPRTDRPFALIFDKGLMYCCWNQARKKIYPPLSFSAPHPPHLAYLNCPRIYLSSPSSLCCIRYGTVRDGTACMHRCGTPGRTAGTACPSSLPPTPS